MDFGGQRGSEKRLFGNLMEDCSPSPMRERNVLNLNKAFLNIIAERDAAVEERNKALIERRKALEEREIAISQRNLAIKERNDAVLKRNEALSALQESINQYTELDIKPEFKSLAHHPWNQMHRANSPYYNSDMQLLDALCAAVQSDRNKSPDAKRTKISKACTVNPRREKKAWNELKSHSAPDQLKLKGDWDNENPGVNRVDFDGSIMPVPGCSCTGVFRNCYKWGKGGWQSSCCTPTLSAYPLPPAPNKGYRICGRKMTGSVFSKLLCRLASEGYDLALPVDLKDFWSKHGTNRYIRVK